MSSHARVISGRGPAKTMGEVEEMFWTVIAAELDGVIQPDEIGRRIEERYVRFAFRSEAEAWIAEQEAEGFAAGDPVPCATLYFGPTDSPSNCWSVSAQKELSS